MREDAQLLQEYARGRSESAFGELVARHIDLVYSVALRIVNSDAHLAQDVTQHVFLDLARKASLLPRDAVLAGWLHRHTSYIAAKAVRTERRRKAREQTAMEMRALDDNAESPWELIAPHLDESLNQLSSSDRDAIVLRFFKGQDLRAIGTALGVSDDAAQKRVGRALDKLRTVLGRRGVALTGAALTSALTAQAATAAPAGLAAAVTAASLTGATAPTFLQIMAAAKLKTGLISAIVIASVATPFLLQQQAEATLRNHNKVLRERADQLVAMQGESTRLSNLLAQTQSPPAPSGEQAIELLRLRGEVARLRKDLLEMLQQKKKAPMSRNDMLASIAQRYSERVAQLKTFLKANPAENIPETQFLTDENWLWLAGQKMPDTEDGFRRVVSLARLTAQQNVVRDTLRPALQQYVLENNGQFPTDLPQLKPYFKSPVDDSLLAGWQILPAGKLVNLRANLRNEDWVITQRAPANAALDQRIIFSLKDVHSIADGPPGQWEVAP